MSFRTLISNQKFATQPRTTLVVMACSTTT